MEDRLSFLNARMCLASSKRECRKIIQSLFSWGFVSPCMISLRNIFIVTKTIWSPNDTVASSTLHPNTPPWILVADWIRIAWLVFHIASRKGSSWSVNSWKTLLSQLSLLEARTFTAWYKTSKALCLTVVSSTCTPEVKAGRSSGHSLGMSNLKRVG